ncbi:MAG TPA: MFS transporter [Pseudonocardiaceae bacterium]|jgi:predicted MFS family arabinose efflux permease|nr:MFS transporter [Pseudonocardiaceae bacterium]
MTATGTAVPAVANRRVVAIMALATGAVVANLYYPQPLEQTLTQALHTSSAAIGIVVTLIQIGYAIGLATLVPLGDLVERRRLLAVMLAVAVLGLALMALAPSVAVFGTAAMVVGLTSVAAQVVVPFAAHLAADGQQGRVVSTVMSGLLIGILLSRTLSGLIASVAGWRAVFGLGAVLTAVIGALLWRELPTLAPTTKLRYPALLASVLRLVREEPLLRMRILYGALVFGSFSAFWASVGFLLARPPYHWNNAAIGAFALVGAAGAAAAMFAGRLADRGLARLATGGFVLVMALSYVLIALGGHSAIALAIGVALMDLGCQATHISNQSLIYPLRPAARSRLNTAYMTAYFVAGATGSALSVAMYAAFGWTGVCVVGAAFPAAACLLWVLDMTVLRPR